MKCKLTIIIILTITIKVILTFLVFNDFMMNPDEERNYQIAFNNQNGNGYTVYNTENKSFIQSAFHGSFTVLVYEFLLKNKIKKEIWIIFIQVFWIILFGLSINYFYKLCLHFLNNEKYALYATLTYCFYPSILIYIGILFSYENLVLPLLVIITYKLLYSFRDGFIKWDYLLIPISVSLSCLFRPQSIAIYFVVFFVYVCIVLIKKSYSLIPLLLLTFSITFLFHIPLLLKNKKMFGEYILSTQTGFELLQGHNPTARGSWMGNWQDSTNQLYQYSHSQIKNISKLNELEESKARQKVAVKWIKENPISEIKLILRKIAIYFLPKNYEVLYGSNFLNPINFFVHVFFLCFILIKLFKMVIKLDDFIIFAPIAASILLSIIFFVGYRWRYYAEPFMIIFAWQFILLLKDKFYRKNMFDS